MTPRVGRYSGIPLPLLTSDGKFFPPALAQYLKRASIPDYQKAEELGVDLHRIVYLQSLDGQRLILGETDEGH